MTGLLAADGIRVCQLRVGRALSKGGGSGMAGVAFGIPLFS